MFQMDNFVIFLDHFGDKAVQVHQIISLGTTWDHVGPKATCSKWSIGNKALYPTCPFIPISACSANDAHSEWHEECLWNTPQGRIGPIPCSPFIQTAAYRFCTHLHSGTGFDSLERYFQSSLRTVWAAGRQLSKYNSRVFVLTRSI